MPAPQSSCHKIVGAALLKSFCYPPWLQLNLDLVALMHQRHCPHRPLFLYNPPSWHWHATVQQSGASRWRVVHVSDKGFWRQLKCVPPVEHRNVWKTKLNCPHSPVSAPRRLLLALASRAAIWGGSVRHFQAIFHAHRFIFYKITAQTFHTFEPLPWHTHTLDIQTIYSLWVHLKNKKSS